MGLKLGKSDRKKQDLIQQALRCGVPLVTLLAASTLSAAGESTEGVLVTKGVPPPPRAQNTAPADTTATATTPATAQNPSDNNNATPRKVATIGKRAPAVTTATSATTQNPPKIDRAALQKAITESDQVFPESDTYVVKPGDTLDLIAKTYGVPLADLKNLNKFDDKKAAKLKIGQKIMVPKKKNQTNESGKGGMVGGTSPAEKKK